MQELLDLILKNITTHPDDVIITTSEEEGMIVYTITVNPEDMGRVIGKNGKVIRAIRSLAHVVGIRKSERYRVNVAEVPGSEQADPASTAMPQDVIAEVPGSEQADPASTAIPQDAVVESSPPKQDDQAEAPQMTQVEPTTPVQEESSDEDIIAGAININEPTTTETPKE